MDKMKTFGEFVYTKRKAQGITQKQIADELGITTVYLCDIEKSRRYPPTNGELLPKLAKALNLNKKEQPFFYDLAGVDKGCVSPDLTDYIMSSDIVRSALRLAKEKATGIDWQNFIHKLDNSEVCK